MINKFINNSIVIGAMIFHDHRKTDRIHKAAITGMCLAHLRAFIQQTNTHKFNTNNQG